MGTVLRPQPPDARLRPDTSRGPPRYASGVDFAAALLPLLEERAASWAQSAAHSDRVATAVRPTQSVHVAATALAAPLCAVSELVAHSLPPSAPQIAFHRNQEKG